MDKYNKDIDSTSKAIEELQKLQNQTQEEVEELQRLLERKKTIMKERDDFIRESVDIDEEDEQNVSQKDHMASQGLAEDSQANLGSMNSTGSKRRMKGKSTRNMDGAGPKGRPAGRANRGVIDEI